jgi:hypothetical protein
MTNQEKALPLREEYVRRGAALEALHSEWVESDRIATPHRHRWRDVLPRISDYLAGATLERINALDEAVQDGFSRSVDLRFRMPDGRSLTLNMSVSTADFAAIPAGPVHQMRQEDAEEQWASDGTGVEVELYDSAWEYWRHPERAGVRSTHPAIEPPDGVDGNYVLTTVVPAMDDWWDDTTNERFERLSAPEPT